MGVGSEEKVGYSSSCFGILHSKQNGRKKELDVKYVKDMRHGMIQTSIICIFRVNALIIPYLTVVLNDGESSKYDEELSNITLDKKESSDVI